MKKFSVDPTEFLESDIYWLPSKIVSRISNIAGDLLNDEWETAITYVYHELYVENEKILYLAGRSLTCLTNSRNAVKKRFNYI